jgi:soluble lytic murein transglycosylase-like protein
MARAVLLSRSWEPDLARRILSRSTSLPEAAPDAFSVRLAAVPGTPDDAAGREQPVALAVASTPRPTPRTLPPLSPEINPIVYSRLTDYEDLIERYSRMNGVEPNLVRALIYVESAGDPEARSHKGAKGLMQLMPATAEEMGVSNPYDPAQNIFGGSRYIGELISRYNHVDLALWAYNAGPEAVARRRLPAETKRFIPEVLRVKSALDARDS